MITAIPPQFTRGLDCSYTVLSTGHSPRPCTIPSNITSEHQGPGKYLIPANQIIPHTPPFRQSRNLVLHRAQGTPVPRKTDHLISSERHLALPFSFTATSATSAIVIVKYDSIHGLPSSFPFLSSCPQVQACCPPWSQSSWGLWYQPVHFQAGLWPFDPIAFEGSQS